MAVLSGSAGSRTGPRSPSGRWFSLCSSAGTPPLGDARATAVSWKVPSLWTTRSCQVSSAFDAPGISRTTRLSTAGQTYPAAASSKTSSAHVARSHGTCFCGRRWNATGRRGGEGTEASLAQGARVLVQRSVPSWPFFRVLRSLAGQRNIGDVKVGIGRHFFRPAPQKSRERGILWAG